MAGWAYVSAKGKRDMSQEPQSPNDPKIRAERDVNIGGDAISGNKNISNFFQRSDVAIIAVVAIMGMVLIAVMMLMTLRQQPESPTREPTAFSQQAASTVEALSSKVLPVSTTPALSPILATPESLAPTVPAMTSILIVQRLSSPSDRAGGITWDGQSLWVTDGWNAIFQMDTEGNLLNNFRLPDTTSRGITWDGTTLWVYTGNNGTLYQLQIIGNEARQLQALNSPAQVFGGGPSDDLAWDGNDLWYTNGYTVHRLDASGHELSRFTIADPAEGLEWDGSRLWLAFNDVPNNTSTLQVVTETGQRLSTAITPLAQIHSLAWADGSLWVLGKETELSPLMLFNLDVTAIVESFLK
ncbi:MAG: hypothetical protein ACT4QE_07510 [Anaerolineales bacterium]